MSNNLLTNKFFLKKFSRYLLVGISALILMVSAQQGLFDSQRISSVLAENPEDISEAPPPPVDSCPFEFVYNECIACNTSQPVSQDCNGDYQVGAAQDDAGCSSWCEQAPPPAPPAPPVQPAPEQPAPEQPAVCVNPVIVSDVCVACNQAQITLRDSCGNISTQTRVDNSCSHLCQQQQQQQQQQPAQEQPAQGGNATITDSGNSTNTNSNTNTNINQGGNQTQTNTITSTTTREVIREVPVTNTRETVRIVQAAQPQVATVAGVQTQVKELPKTGLPLLAWSVLALIPTGLRLKKLGTVKKDMEDNPNFIWEDRKFRAEV